MSLGCMTLMQCDDAMSMNGSHVVGKSAMTGLCKVQCHVCLVTHTKRSLHYVQSTFHQGERSQNVSSLACPQPAVPSRVSK